jgi:hypothetical protein
MEFIWFLKSLNEDWRSVNPAYLLPFTGYGNGNLLLHFTTTQQPNINIEAYKYHTAFC